MCFVKDYPESHGISSRAILDFIDDAEKSNDISLINFMLLSDKYILAQFCKKPYDINDVQLLFSVTKSITSLGIGIAYDKGFLGLEDKVIAFFPDKLPDNVSENLSRMTVRHLLTMTTGIHDNTYNELYPKKDWVKAFLAQDFPHEPGTYYRYSTHASHMLSAIIEKATGHNLLDYLDENLFKPLRIPRPQWESSPDGIIAGGMGLSLTPLSLAKIGMLLLHRGEFEGKRIISESYLDMATSAQVVKQDAINKAGMEYSGNQYGFQFHMGSGGSYRADGSFGQLCFIYPEKNLIIVATSRNTRTGTLLSLIHKYFIDNSGDGSFNESTYSELENKLRTMRFQVPDSVKVPKGIPLLQNKCYVVDTNPNGVRELYLNHFDNYMEVKILNENNIISELNFNFNHPVCGKSLFVKDIEVHMQKYISYAAWRDSSTLEMTVIYNETPYMVTYLLSFDDDKVIFSFSMNVSLNLKNFTSTGFLK